MGITDLIKGGGLVSACVGSIAKGTILLSAVFVLGCGNGTRNYHILSSLPIISYVLTETIQKNPWIKNEISDFLDQKEVKNVLGVDLKKYKFNFEIRADSIPAGSGVNYGGAQ